MLHSGDNVVMGVPVAVERKRTRRINIRIGRDGVVRLSVPKWWATLKEGEDFLLSKWGWVVKAREKAMSRPAARAPCTEAEVAALRVLLCELNAHWAARHHVQLRAGPRVPRSRRVRGSTRADASQGAEPRAGVLPPNGRAPPGMEGAPSRTQQIGVMTPALS